MIGSNELWLLLAAGSLGVWIYLIGARGRFWAANVREERNEPAVPLAWSSVAAVVPARDEAELIGESLATLLAQDYPGPFTVIVVDDQSTDGTAAVAAQAAKAAGAEHRLTILWGQPLPAGWTGKVWAMKQGIAWAETAPERPRYLLLTDADIAYGPGALRRLVARAQAHGLVLTSLMVKLRSTSAAEKSLIPAFVFFFQMLYPFGWVNRPHRATAAAAGGCMLVEREALRAAGGIDAIRGALIDDCALAKRLKRIGPIWLGLTLRVKSLRAYASFDDIRRMVARSAYDQLRCSPALLAGTVGALALTFFAPPLSTLLAPGLARMFGILAWLLMAISFQPTLRFYRRSPLWGAALPLIAAGYLAFTLNSAYQHRRGRGGLWKGRIQANASEMP
jgi:hopene-associated glycosyltransferase HpnB